MTILSNIGAFIFIAFILLILCIISFFKKMEKQNNMDVLPLFFYDFYYINNGRYNKIGTPRRRVFSTLSFILFIFFLVLAILSVIKKTGVAKNNLLLQPYYLSFLLRYQVFQILLLKNDSN